MTPEEQEGKASDQVANRYEWLVFSSYPGNALYNPILFLLVTVKLLSRQLFCIVATSIQ